MESGFEGLDSKLNTNFHEALDNVESALDNFNNKKTEMIEKSKIGEYTLDDEEYLRFELKTLVQGSRLIMDKLERDIKIGSQPRIYEVYSALLKTTIDGLKELRELNNNVTNFKVIADKPKLAMIQAANSAKLPAPTVNNTTTNVILTGKDLLSMIKSAKDESTIHAIDATFEFGDVTKL